MVANACNAVSWKNGARVLQVQELHSEALSQNQANKRRKDKSH